MWSVIGTLVVVAIATAPSTVRAATFSGKVTQLPGNETLVVRDEKKISHPVRLAWIDFPEARQRYYPEAQRGLRELVLGKQVTVEWDRSEPNCIESGKATRLKCAKLGRVLQGGTDVNLELLRRGLAWHDASTVDEQSTTDRQLYPYEQSEARKKKLGLWSQKNPVPPWEFRSRNPSSTPKAKAKSKAKAKHRRH